MKRHIYLDDKQMAPKYMFTTIKAPWKLNMFQWDEVTGLDDHQSTNQSIRIYLYKSWKINTK